MSIEQIKGDLLECYNCHKPVLLCGNNDIDRENLIRDVHMMVANNIDADGEYLDDDGKPTSKEELADKYKDLYKSKSPDGIDNSSIEHLMGEYLFTSDYRKSTTNTWKHVDCGAMTAKEVYIELVIDVGIIDAAKTDEETKKLLDDYMDMDICRINTSELEDIRNKYIQKRIIHLPGGIHYERNTEDEQVYKGYLFQQKGSLFIDNIRCGPNSRQDKDCFLNLGKIIKDRVLGYPYTTFNWLAVYTYNPNDFPDYFIEQFKPISLDVEVKEEEIEIDYVRKSLKYNNNAIGLQAKQIELFKFLWENRDEIVRRSDIDKVLWPETDDKEPTSPTQIDQQINKLRDGLEKLGFKREIIMTHKKDQLGKGAYEFHSNLSAFLNDS